MQLAEFDAEQVAEKLAIDPLGLAEVRCESCGAKFVTSDFSTRLCSQCYRALQDFKAVGGEFR